MSQKPKRPSPYAYRPPVALEDEFKTRVKRSGLSVNAYLTQCWYGKLMLRQVRRPPIEKQLLAQMLAMLADIHDELKEITKKHDINDIKIATERSHQRLLELRSFCFKALGRKP